MSVSGRRYRTMQHLSTTLLFVALVIAVNVGDGAMATEADDKADQVAEETASRTRTVTIIEPPKYVNSSNATDSKLQPEQRPPSKPPNIPDKLGKQIKLYSISQPYYAPVVQKVQPRPYPVPNKPVPHGQSPHPNPKHGLSYSPNPKPLYKLQQVIPLKNRPYYQPPRQSLLFAASTGQPYIITAKSPKFSLPVQTVNGIRTEFVRPPKSVVNQTNKKKTKVTYQTTTTNTTTTTTTTQKPLRNKRIWPKRVLQNATESKEVLTTFNKTIGDANTTRTDDATTNTDDLDNAQSIIRVRFANRTLTTTTEGPSTTRGYQRVTRIPKHKSTTTTPAPFNSNLTIEPNDWVPIIPSHYPNVKKPGKIKIIHSNNRRSEYFPMHDNEYSDRYVTPERDRRTMYLQSYGLIPVKKLAVNPRAKKMIFFRKRRQLNPHYSGFSPKPVGRPSRGHYIVEDLHREESRRPPRHKVLTKIKHHHHHHHHKYVKTIEKKVPVKVEVPKPYPVEKKIPYPYPVPQYVPVEKKVPYPVTVEKKVPYPVHVKVPMPVPVKVIEKEYIPKPYPIIHHVPVYKQVEVKVPHPVPFTVEKEVQVPYEVKVPVDRPVPYPVQVEKKVPYPVPVKVFVPQPYPVEKRVPYPVEVKVREPYEVIKHVPIKVPVPQPFAVKVPQPVRVEVEKKVPYPVEVEKKVPVPFKVFVPQRVEVEKRVPVYVPKPFPVEKRVPVPVKVPYPVQVPIRVPYEVPVGVPVYLHPAEDYNIVDVDYNVHAGFTVSDDVTTTSEPGHTVTVHGNTGFQGFASRSDDNLSTEDTSSEDESTEYKETSTANPVIGHGKGFTLSSDEGKSDDYKLTKATPSGFISSSDKSKPDDSNNTTTTPKS